MSIYRVVKVQDIFLDKQRLDTLYMLLEEWIRVNNYKLEVKYDGETIVLSTGRYHGKITIGVDSDGKLRIGSYPEGEYDFRMITGFELHEKVRELAIASDYIVTARENGWMIEEIDLREFKLEAEEGQEGQQLGEELEEEELEEIKLLI